MSCSKFEQVLSQVQMPGQYVGGEINSIIKPEVPFRLALCFPDTYAIGMSNHGCRILYEIVNSMDEWACERAYTPLPDMEEKMRENALPMATLESKVSLADCAAVTFSMQYELGTSSMLTMLDLAGITLLREERGEDEPFILGGGHSFFNPEPLADFFDVMFIGEGEEGLPQMLRIISENRGKLGRAKIIEKIAHEVTGAYAPSLYETEEEDGFTVIRKGAAPYPVKRAVVTDFENCPTPIKPVVPVVETVHERVVLELMRGCPNGCRFCQAGMICRPVRERSVDTLLESARTCYKSTGYDEIGLLSLSTSDYSQFDELIETLDSEFSPLGVSLSLPSLRVNQTLFEIPKKFKSVRKSGLTIAPEAGSERMRLVINKDVTRENLLESVKQAFSQGWKSVKLYFMVGLPTEEDEDVLAIAELSNDASRLSGKGGRGPAITCSVSNFIPKPFTPFQWEAMDITSDFVRKQEIIANKVWQKKVSFKGHDSRVSFLEGVLARGDRKLGKVILSAWQKGARLESWSDHFKPELWDEAFAENDIDPLKYLAERKTESRLPWSHIDIGVSEEFLLREREKSRQQVMTPRCSAEDCAGCGVENCTHNK